jgi:hypothetical protein
MMTRHIVATGLPGPAPGSADPRIPGADAITAERDALHIPR